VYAPRRGWLNRAAATNLAVLLAGLLQANLPTPFYAVWHGQMQLSNAAVTWVWTVYIIGVIATLLIVRRLGNGFLIA
jgi:hypothetical protein